MLVGGPEAGPLAIVAYDPAWPARFAAVRARLAAALGPAALRIEHIGSTAVPGLAAKPIVDVLVVVADPDDEAAFRPALESAGYVLRVVEPGHRMFRTPDRDVHVHVWAQGAEARDYLRLREVLRGDAAARRDYGGLKRALARLPWPSMDAYADAKGPFIRALLARAAP